MIHIQNLQVSVGEKDILKGVSLDFELGKNYCLLGKNGSGKSTLSSVLMGHPKYEVTGGEITITLPQTSPDNPHPNPLPKGEGTSYRNLLEMEPNERSNAGIFLSFQNIPEIQGVKLSEYLRTIYNIAQTSPQLSSSSPHPNPLPKGEGENTEEKMVASSLPLGEIEGGQNEDKAKEFKGLSPFLFKRFIKKHLDELHIDEKFLDRDLNVGFSGGEKRKIEILQMKLIGPKYIILDEIDSGLDLDAFKTVATMLQSLSSPENSIIIITHYFTILEYIDVDTVFVMKDGNIVKQGGKDLAKEISENGFGEI